MSVDAGVAGIDRFHNLFIARLAPATHSASWGEKGKPVGIRHRAAAVFGQSIENSSPLRTLRFDDSFAGRPLEVRDEP
jgi:hypothetical protein